MLNPARGSVMWHRLREIGDLTDSADPRARRRGQRLFSALADEVKVEREIQAVRCPEPSHAIDGSRLSRLPAIAHEVIASFLPRGAVLRLAETCRWALEAYGKELGPVLTLGGHRPRTAREVKILSDMADGERWAMDVRHHTPSLQGLLGRLRGVEHIRVVSDWPASVMTRVPFVVEDSGAIPPTTLRHLELEYGSSGTLYVYWLEAIARGAWRGLESLTIWGSVLHGDLSHTMQLRGQRGQQACRPLASLDLHFYLISDSASLPLLFASPPCRSLEDLRLTRCHPLVGPSAETIVASICLLANLRRLHVDVEGPFTPAVVAGAVSAGRWPRLTHLQVRVSEEVRARNEYAQLVEAVAARPGVTLGPW